MWELIGKLVVLVILVQLALAFSPFILFLLAIYGGYILISGKRFIKKEE